MNIDTLTLRYLRLAVYPTGKQSNQYPFMIEKPEKFISTLRIQFDEEFNIIDDAFIINRKHESECVELSDEDKLRIIDYMHYMKENDKESIYVDGGGDHYIVYSIINKLKLAAYFSEDNE